MSDRRMPWEKRTERTVEPYKGGYVACVLQGRVLETDIIAYEGSDIWRYVDGPDVDEPWMHPYVDTGPSDTYQFASVEDLKVNRKTPSTPQLYEYIGHQGRFDGEILNGLIQEGWRIVARDKHPTRPDMDEWILERPA